DYVYLLPGADFRAYNKVMLDPTELAFKKNWLRDYNNSTMSLSSRLSGPDVLRLRTAVVDISINAPDVKSVGRSRSYSGEAGFATLIVEARDSVSGALLGRAVDGKVVGDNSMLLRNSVTNRSDFRQLMKRWADISVKGLGELKAQSPINDQGARQGQ